MKLCYLSSVANHRVRKVLPIPKAVLWGKLKGAQCSETVKSRVPSIWFVWKIWDFLVAQGQKLGARGHQAPLEHSPDTNALVLRSHKFSCVFFIFIANVWLFRVFVICKNKVCCGSTCRRLVDPQHFDNVIHDIILSSIRGHSGNKKPASIC